MRRTIGAAALIAMTALLPAGAAAQQSFGDAQGIGGGMGAGQYLPNQPGQMGGQQPQPGFGGQPTQFNGQQGEFGGQQGQANQFGRQQWQPDPSGNQFGGQNAQPGQFGGQQGQSDPSGNQFGGQNGQPGQFGGQQGQPGFGGQPEQPGGYAGQYGGQPGQFGGQPGQLGAQPGQPGQMGSPSGAFGGQAGQPGQNPGNGAPAQFSQMLDQLAQFERQDFGVRATDQLHQGSMHGPTPASIPGGQVITTKGLVELVQSQQTPYLLFDVLGSGETLPGAIPAVQAATPGSFNDQVSQQMGQYLQQATRGNTQIPLVFYCASVECWMSYNAALRAIKLGYSNVLWYRGGLAAWKSIGAPTVAAGAAWQGGQPGQGTQ